MLPYMTSQDFRLHGFVNQITLLNIIVKIHIYLPAREVRAYLIVAANN